MSDNPERARPPSQPRILISICIPTLNRARFLKEAIESIAPQLTPDLELIVCDTGSNDGTTELMAEIQRTSQAVRYVRREEILGVDEALLLLLQQSRGKYVWFFGSDDILKPRAINKIRSKIMDAAVAPTLVHVNHEIVDVEGKLLIASQLREKKDRHYSVGWRCVPRLGIGLGYISACIVRRKKIADLEDSRHFIGSRWLSLHLYLSALIAGGAAEVIAEPLLRARRNPSACAEYSEVFVRQLARVLRTARRNGYPWHVIYRTMNHIIATQYLRFVVSWRADDPAELARSFPAMLRTCWRYPAFWLLLLPVRVLPAGLVRASRNSFRDRRSVCNMRRSVKPELV